MGKSSTHTGFHPACQKPLSWPIFVRSAPSDSLTTFALSAPKSTRSPSRAPVRSTIAATAVSERFLTIGDCRPSRPLCGVVDLYVCQTFSAVDGSELGVGVDLATRELSAVWDARRGDASAGHIRCIREYLELDLFHHVRELGQHESNAQIRFIRAIQGQGLGIAHARKRVRQTDIQHLLEYRAQHLLHQRCDLGDAEERGFDVNL